MEETFKDQSLRMRRARVLLEKVKQRIEAFPTGLVQVSWKGASVIVKFTQDIYLEEGEDAEG